MRKILIALVTFLLGVFAFNLLNFEKIKTSQIDVSVQKVAEISDTQVEDISKQKTENPKTFFDSFNENEGYSSWLVADNFKGMPEVWTILLRRDNKYSKEEKLFWSATVLTQHADYSSNDDDDFHSVWIKTENNRLRFGTNKIRGIEYKFDGEFFKNGKEFSDDEKILKGTLQKIVKGKVIAKFTAEFAYHEPVCFH